MTHYKYISLTDSRVTMKKQKKTLDDLDQQVIFSDKALMGKCQGMKKREKNRRHELW